MLYVSIVIALVFGATIVFHLAYLRAAVRNVLRRQRAYTPAPLIRENLDGPVHVFLPIRRPDARSRRTIEALLQQTLRPDRIVVIVEAGPDARVAWLQELCRSHERLSLIVATQAEHCGQKNRNLLTGIAAYPDARYYAFCDADTQPGPYWLADHLARLLRDPALDLVSTHQWVRRQPGTGNFYYTSLHAMMIALGSHPTLKRSGVWGGSFVIRAERWRDERVPELWSAAVSTDVVLQHLINRGRLRTHYAPELVVDGESPGLSFFATAGWFVRQMTCVKLYTPEVWLPLTFVHMILTVAYLALPAAPLLHLLVPAAAGPVYAAAIPGLVHLVCIPLIRRVRRSGSESYLAWLPRCYLPIMMGGIIFTITAFTYSVRWGGRTYRMKPGGDVIEIKFTETRQEAA